MTRFELLSQQDKEQVALFFMKILTLSPISSETMAAKTGIESSAFTLLPNTKNLKKLASESVLCQVIQELTDQTNFDLSFDEMLMIAIDDITQREYRIANFGEGAELERLSQVFTKIIDCNLGWKKWLPWHLVRRFLSIF